MVNPTLYDKYSLEKAAKLITKLKKRLDKQQKTLNQIELFDLP